MKKSKPKIIRTINTGIFDATIALCVGFDYDSLYKKLNENWRFPIKQDKALIDSGNYFALQRTTQCRNGKKYFYHYIILTREFSFTDYEMCLLAHEVLHICQFFMKDLLNMDEEMECVAYTHTHIMKQCLKEIRTAYKK